MTHSPDDKERPIDEESFVRRYSQVATNIVLGGRALNLGQLVELEAIFCTVDPEQRQTEADRLRFLASKIGEEALDPKHHFLLQPTPKS